MKGGAFLCSLAGMAFTAVGLPYQAYAAEMLQPYQLVRSLQLIQDRIAAGDHAALPMQEKLLEIVDARLRTASPETFKEPKNFRALLVYGMSGGNPVTVEAATSRIELDPNNEVIAEGVVDYLNGRPAAAIEAFTPIDPMQLSPDLGAFVALVKGSLLAPEKPVEALALLDQARLLSPGTLVEEAALRRSIAIAATKGDAARFALASTQYVERYLHSPYASQFADAFVNGVIAMHEAISHDKLADITSMMDAEREKVIYLRIARRAAIDGLNELSAYASAKAEQGRDGNSNDDDPRALLYAGLSEVTSATIGDVRAKLKTIDRSQLSESDRSLLEAAQAVISEMVAAPAPLSPKPVPATVTPEASDAGANDPISGAQASIETDLPVVEGAMPEKTAAEAPVMTAPEPVALKQPVEATASPIPAKDGAVVPNATDAAIADARRKLESIDQILGASPK